MSGAPMQNPGRSATPPDELKLGILPLPASVRTRLGNSDGGPYVLSHPDWFNWCPSVLRADDGRYHMFYARWPKSIGFRAWLTHSQIMHAVSESPTGPFANLGVAIPSTGPDRGDWFTAHNPKIKKFGDRYYLYFIQTRGDSFAADPERLKHEMATTGFSHPLWKSEARPNQRTFIACADRLDGPWRVTPEPIVQPAGTIATIANNPAVCRGPDGTYFMIVKGDRLTGKGLKQALATAPSPEGPWTIQDVPVIDDLDTEDVSMWYDQTRARFYAVFHTYGHNSPPNGFIGMITSADGYRWEKASQYRLLPKEIPLDDGSTWKPDRMERPFVLTDAHGRPQVLYVACQKGDVAAIVALPVDAEVLELNRQ